MGLSNAERQERWRNRRDKEMGKLKARVAELEAAIKAPRAAAQAQAQQVPLRNARLHKPTAEDRRSDKLAARVRELEALLAPLDGPGKTELARYKRKLDQEFLAYRRDYDKLTKAYIRRHSMTMDSPTYGKILAGLHPDASKQIRDQARHTFEQYKKFVVQEKDKILSPLDWT